MVNIVCQAGRQIHSNNLQYGSEIDEIELSDAFVQQLLLLYNG